MKVLESILIALVALLHVYFLVLEMFFWNKPAGLKAFNLQPDFAEKTKSLAANQGLYNGFIALGLLWSLVEDDLSTAHTLSVYLLSCVVVAGIYGWYSTGKAKIVFVQALPALLALLLVMSNGL